MKKLLTTLVISLLAFILAINLYRWVSNPDYFNNHFSIDTPLSPSRESFFGFRDLFEYIKTFPGLTYTFEEITYWGDLVGNFKITDMVWLDSIIAVIRIIFLPAMVLSTLIVDIFRNLVWFFNILTLH